VRSASNMTTIAGRPVAVVEDDVSVRQSLLRLLRSSGRSAVGYESAEEFLMRYSQDTPGCLVLDIHLRGMSGIDLLEKLATENVVIPIVFITAIDEAPSGEELRRPGVTCLQKPFDEALLIQAIDTATGGSPAATGD
jgi:FixJ family two-component response regulator